MGARASLCAAAVIAASALQADADADNGEGVKESRAESGRVVRVVHNPPGDAPSLGPRFAPVTIEFFADLSDYTTTYRVSERLRELAERHPLRLRIVYRLVKRARGAFAEAALEAFAQGRFHAYLKAFYALHRRTPAQKEIKSIAEGVGVDFSEIEKAWLDHRHASAVTANHWRQRRFAITRTPGLLINGKTVSNPPRDLAALEALYDDAYEQSMILVGEGVALSDLYDRMLAERAANAVVPRLAIEQVDGPRLGAKIESRDNGFELKGAVDYDGPYSEGPRDAPAQVVAYCAVGTRHCNTVASELSNLRAAYGDDVRIVYKPVEIGLEEEQAEAAREIHIAADCAGEQGLFWSFLGRIQIRSRRPPRDRLDKTINDAAERVGVDVEKLETCRSRSDGGLARAALVREALDVGVIRVPSIVIGGRLYIGSLSFGALSALVDLELAPGLLERWLED